MPYRYLEDGVTADVTFDASGTDLDELFTAAADATTNVMVDVIEAVRPQIRRPVEIRASELDMLLFRFLGEILFYMDAEALITRACAVHVEETGDGYRLCAELRGERLEPTRHHLAADAKGVTLSGLRVARADGGWSATVTLDI